MQAKIYSLSVTYVILTVVCFIVEGKVFLWQGLSLRFSLGVGSQTEFDNMTLRT